MSTASESNTGTSTYTYDAAGNLQSVTYPNGVVHTYSYDVKNRLTNLAAAGGSGATPANFSYAYTLDNAGHRLSVTEQSGRSVQYAYDSIYRLTSEAVSADRNGNNGTVNYTYDHAGNRTQQTSTNPGISSGGYGYDADDRLSTDGYDANGNTVGSGGLNYVYDFENHLIQQGGATMVYDGDGNRVSKTVAGVTTTYLVSEVNPTGYVQVLSERFSGGSGAQEVLHNYVYGLDRISQYRSYFTGSQSLTQISYYVYDGHGSTRALTDPNGNVTDTYDYDAFGNLTHSATTLSSPTPNEFLFAGEQYDLNLHLYYNRARYLNTSTGRFWSMDAYEGDDQEPLSLHKYLYTEADPVDSIDPTGRTLSNFVYGQTVHDEIGADFTASDPSQTYRLYDRTINTILNSSVPGGSLRPDLADRSTQEVYEIKPAESAALGYPQLAGYLIILNRYDPQKRTWIPGATYFPPPTIDLGGGVIAFAYPPAGGVIVYDVFNPVEILGLVALAIRLSVPTLQTDFAAAEVEEAL